MRIILLEGVMKKIYTIVTAGLVGFTLFAQDDLRPSDTARDSQAGPSTNSVAVAGAGQSSSSRISDFNKASKFLKMQVTDATGKQLGKVQDLVFDLEKGQLGYAVLALNNGSTNRIVPVPLTALKPAAGSNQLVLNMSSAVLAAAPGVGNDEWPRVEVFAVGGAAGAEKGTGSSSAQPANEVTK
jgi:hypothetical protein